MERPARRVVGPIEEVGGGVMMYQAPEDRWRDEARAKPLGLWSPPKPEPIVVEAMAQFTY